VALLRAVNIPSGYGIMKVKGPDYFGPITIPKLARNVSSNTTHIYCYVFLNNKWLKCDPSDDESLSKNTYHINPQSKIVEWTGISHAELNLSADHIKSNSEPIANIDYIFRKKPKFWKRIPIYFGNLYIDFLRECGRTVTDIFELENAFLIWLKRKHIFAYIFFNLFFIIQDIFKK
jgi:hypothetical protein